jgi:hypothetical protein
MLKNGLHWVTANRGHPDASDLRAARSVVDRVVHRGANTMPRVEANDQCRMTNDECGGAGFSFVIRHSAFGIFAPVERLAADL